MLGSIREKNSNASIESSTPKDVMDEFVGSAMKIDSRLMANLQIS